MQVVSGIEELLAARARLAGPVGLVPTMGYLHEGHLSLVRLAGAECKSVVVSIFVNPSQFGPNEDLARYPRDLSRDLAMLKGEGVDLVWTPAPEAMFPPGYQTWVTVADVSRPLEGNVRPGHFRGVATIVAKLFAVVQPDVACFGQKDAQQVVVIRTMARDLNFPVRIRVGPTVREADGLAMSSRNTFLQKEERRAAAVLFRGLLAAQSAFAAGERDAELLRRAVCQTVAQEPLVRLHYVSCADAETLEELRTISNRCVLSLAALVGSTRLIDNIVLGDG